MTRDEAKDYILSNADNYLERDRSRKGFICPICKSGSGKKGTGITENKDKPGHYTCWAGCFSSSDIIDIIGLEYGETDYNRKLALACSAFGISIDEYQNYTKNEQYTHTHKHIHIKEKPKEQPKEEEKEDFTSFFKECNANLKLTTYRRGISQATLDRFLVGYCEAWKHPKAPEGPESPRLIIPTSKYSYLARDTRDNLDEKQKQYSKPKVGAVHSFNIKALERATKPIIIVEGEIDALSIIDAGGEAIGLGSVNQAKNLLELLKTVKPKAPLIISLDNDNAGARNTKILEEGLESLKIPYYTINVAEGYKDANEALTDNREAFIAVIDFVERIEEWKLEEEREKLKKEAVANSMDDFLAEIKESEKASFVSTGFKGVDKVLDGGLYPGLYVIGAISSLGKTTFALQIADNIAKAGRNVLIFSLEMAKNELIAKSISRITAIEALKIGNTTNAKTTRGILTGTRYKDYNEDEKELIEKAIRLYKDYASNIYISEGVGNIGVEQIREAVERHIKITGKAPIVIIDYLQILAPYNERATDKQNTDKAVLELKRISRDYKTSIIGISSFNRDNYNAPVNLASFKESGAIEYSSDVLIALQYEGMDYQAGEKEQERDKRIRELIKEQQALGREGKTQTLQVKILKNRNGSKGESAIKFYPMFNYFLEDISPKFEEVSPDEDIDEILGWSKAEQIGFR